MEHVGLARLVAERSVQREALLVQLQAAVELAEDVDGSSQRAERRGAHGRVDGLRVRQELLEPPSTLERVGIHPEVFERDGKAQAELELAMLEGPLKRGAKVRQLGTSAARVVLLGRLDTQVGGQCDVEVVLRMTTIRRLPRRPVRAERARTRGSSPASRSGRCPSVARDSCPRATGARRAGVAHVECRAEVEALLAKTASTANSRCSSPFSSWWLHSIVARNVAAAGASRAPPVRSGSAARAARARPDRAG